MRVAVLYNPIAGAGRAERMARQIEVALRAAGFAVLAIPTQQDRAEDWLRPALTGVEALVVVGGDGAVRMAAPEAARAGIPLWHAAGGTENLFARFMRMSADPSAIVAALRALQVWEIDLGSANGAPFSIMASIGFDADVVHALAANRRGAISHWSYLAPIVRTMRLWKPPALTWTVDGVREELGQGMIVVGNLPNYGVRLNPTPDALPDDGLLDGVFLPAKGALEVASWIPYLWTGLHRRHRQVRVRRGRVFEIQASVPARLQLDGDAAGDALGREAYRIECVSPRLRVLMPADLGPRKSAARSASSG